MYLVILICILLLTSCNDLEQKDGSLCITIDFIGAQQRCIYMDEIFDRIEIVPLETSSSCFLTGEPYVLALTDSFIVLSNSTRKAFLFDRKSGCFIHEIGKKGSGPNEYYYLLFDACFDQYHELLYANKGNKWIGMNIKDNIVGDFVHKPKMRGKDGILSVINPYRLNDSLYIGYVNNLTGEEKLKLVVFNREGEVIRHYWNSLQYNMDKKELISFCPGYFYNYDTDICFYGGAYKDTIYTVSENLLSPKYAIALNEKSPYEVLGSSEYKSRDFNYLIHMMEYKSYLLFSYFEKGNLESGIGFYDKKREKTVRSGKTDGGFVFRGNERPPFFFRYMNDKGYVVGYWTAIQWIEFLEKYGQSLRVPEYLSNIKNDDNPIMIIAHVKI